MATPTTSIDALPAKTAPAGTELLIVQDAGVTKKMAINEMVALPSPALTAHLADTDDAHDATAVSATDSGNGINGANVQAQLGQLSTLAKGGSDAAVAADAKIIAHMADALDAHDASAISAIAGVILTGVDVQAQLTQIEAVLANGTVGPEGPQGPAGPGVPIGGTTGQLLSKINATDYSTQWVNPATTDFTQGYATYDPRYVNVTGDTMTGNLFMTATQDGTASALTRKDYVDGQLANKVGITGNWSMAGQLNVGAGLNVAGFQRNATADLYMGNGDPATGTGAKFRTDGTIINTFFADDSAHGVLAPNLSLTRAKTPVADAGGIFARFNRSGGGVASAVQIGSVTIATGGTGVLYNTTSDERLKTFTRDVDDDEALETVRAMRPLHFTWNSAPEIGEQIGFFAQELHEIAPEAVNVGNGEPGDEDFVPWGTDVGRLVPRLVAAMQATQNKMTALRTELATQHTTITALQAEVATLKHGHKK